MSLVNEILAENVTNSMKDFAEVSILSYRLFEDKDKAKEWLFEENEFLFGSSPFEVCLRGDSEHLLNWLKGRLGDETGTQTLSEDGDEHSS